MDPKNSNKPFLVSVAGTLPPPIGGVTVHVKRLIEHLEQSNIQYEFYGRKAKDLLKLLFGKCNSDVVHIHHSNAIARWIIVKVLSLKKIKTIITIHRDLGREKGMQKYFTIAAISSSTIPIVLNHDSFEKAKTINTKALKLSAFIPPQPNMPLVEDQQKELKASDDIIFCTNAYDLVYDNSNNEIYQISELVNIFSQLDKRFQLIVSDPSGNNYKYIKDKVEISENILFITKPHNFVEIIVKSHCLIRATTTDGDSISIKEALYYGVNVIASDCVDRPTSCILFKTRNRKDLIQKIRNFKRTHVVKPENGFPEILKLYKSISQLS